MNTINSFLVEAIERLSLHYESKSEIKAIAQALLMETLGLSLTDLLLLDKDTALSEDNKRTLSAQLLRLEQGEPLQYILGYTYFLDFKIGVAPGVLIPRPETEELIDLVVSRYVGYSSQVDGKLRILDVGTGSGCIPLGLSRLMPADLVEQIEGIDVSRSAIDIAQRNLESVAHSIPIKLRQADLFTLPQLIPEDAYHILISNPPYIHPTESEHMSQQVLAWEPHSALFAPAELPTIFYDAIAKLYHKGYLVPKGHIFLEINPLFANETLESMVRIIGVEHIDQAEVILDISQKQRFIHIGLLN